MEATASTRSPSTWNSSSQYNRVGDQEVAHLGAAEVEDERAPVGLFAAARVGVFVQRGAVEPGQRPFVRGKCLGTQSRITPIPAMVQRVTR